MYKNVINKWTYLNFYLGYSVYKFDKEVNPCLSVLPSALITDESLLSDGNATTCINLNQVIDANTLWIAVVLHEQHYNLTLTMVTQDMRCDDPYLVVSVKSGNCTEQDCLEFIQCNVQTMYGHPNTAVYNCLPYATYDTVYIQLNNFNRINSEASICSMLIV